MPTGVTVITAVGTNYKCERRVFDELINNYKSGKRSLYSEELYFQYGRYLLISGSRPNTYPRKPTRNMEQVSVCAMVKRLLA